MPEVTLVADGGNERKTRGTEHVSKVRTQFFRRRQLPVVLQAEAAECGLACLAMVASHHGHHVDLASMRVRFPTSLKGMGLSKIISIAAQLGLASRPLRLDMDSLSQLRTPCLLHWDMNHFVVLKKVTKRGLVIHDPAKGVRRLRMKDASSHFTGIGVEMTPREDFQALRMTRVISLRALTGRLHGIVPALLQILLLALALEVCALIAPFYVQLVIDQVLVASDRNLLNVLALSFFALVVFRAAIAAARTWAVTSLSATVYVQWSSSLVGHLLRLPLDWFEKRHVGDVISRLDSARTMQRTMTIQSIGSLLDGVMSLAAVGIMLMYSPVLTALVICLFVLYGLLRWILFNPLRRSSENQLIQAARQESQLLELVRGILPIKLANQQDERRIRYANASVETTNCDVRIQRLGVLFSAGNDMIFGAGRVALIWIAATQVLESRFSAGMLIAFIAYADQFLGRASGLIDKWVEFRMLGLHAERIADIALGEPETHDAMEWTGSVPASSLEIRNVSFRYAEGDPWILKKCSMRIEPGQSLAIVGASGSGKTTLAKILLGLLEPTEGSVLFGGVPLASLGAAYYRSLIGAVMQDDQLFAGSIADNISFGTPLADMADISEAARLASIHESIVAMPMGYQSLVGDMGSSLSGGQKQRVILARALYRKPALLLLDEATSHLDVECEFNVTKSIDELSITRIVIAHRKETIAGVDKVVEMDGGILRVVRDNQDGR